MRELSLFTGAGGGVLGTKLLGWTTVGYVEYEPYCQQIIRQRIEDGILDAAPIFGDIRRFLSEGYASAYQGLVDVVTAGFPCQPFSVAGKQQGADDARNMWPATLGVIREVRPRFCLLENVGGLVTSGYFGTILGGLAESGYDCRWRILSAAEMGAPHKRDRLWIVAHTKNSGFGGAGHVHQYARGAGTERPGEAISTRTDSEHEDPSVTCEGVADPDTAGDRTPECKIDGIGPETDEGRSRQPQSELGRFGQDLANPESGGFPVGGGTSGEAGHLDGGNEMADPSIQGPQGLIGEEFEGRGNRPPYLGQVRWWETDPADVGDTERVRFQGHDGRGTREELEDGYEFPRINKRRPKGAESPTEPELGRVAHGVANRVDRLKAIGNGQVPAVAAAAWRILTEGMDI